MSAYLKLRGDGPSFLLESAEQGQRFGRWSFLGCRPRTVIRWSQGDGGRPLRAGRARAGPLQARAGRGAAAVRRRRRGHVRLRPRPLRRADRGRGQPRRARPARHGADGERRAGGLRPPAPRGHDPGQRVRGGRRRRGLRRRRRRRSPTCASAWRSRCRARTRGRREPPAFTSNIGSEGYADGGGALQGVHPRGRRLPGGAEPALERRLAGGGVLDLPRPARDQPQPLHVLPRLRGLRDRGRVAGVADQGRGAPRRAAPDRRHPPARGHGGGRPRARARSCWPTRRSAPST